MIAHGDESSLGGAGHERIKSLDQAIAQIGVVRKLSKRERAVPGADLAIKDRAWAVLVRAGDEMLGQRLADLLRRSPPQASC
ncbi:MAG: hypothetical protein WDM87_08445 [Terracidiphilus sp.]